VPSAPHRQHPLPPGPAGQPGILTAISEPLRPGAGFVTGFLNTEGVFEVDIAPVDDRHEQDERVNRFVANVGRPATGVLRISLKLADGAVEKRTIEFEEELSPETLAATSSHLSSHLVGSPLAKRETLPPSGDSAVDDVVLVALNAITDLGAHERDHVFVGGSSSMASAFDAVETVRSVLSILEQQLVVVELIEDVLDSGLSVAIGSEHGFEPLASCALVVAPVEVNGEDLGTIGVLGPTRMNYPKALAAVRLVGEELAERLGRHREDLEGSSRGS